MPSLHRRAWRTSRARSTRVLVGALEQQQGLPGAEGRTEAWGSQACRRTLPHSSISYSKLFRASFLQGPIEIHFQNLSQISSIALSTNHIPPRRLTRPPAQIETPRFSSGSQVETLPGKDPCRKLFFPAIPRPPLRMSCSLKNRAKLMSPPSPYFVLPR